MKAAMAIFIILCGDQGVRAQIPVLDLINAVAKKVVVAIDLKVQALQTQTIQLQAAEKQVENAMQSAELGDIIGWVQQQEQLYQEYYQELWEVKTAISGYERVAELIAREGQIVAQAQQMSSAIRQDRHLTPAEVSSIGSELAAIVKESSQNLGQIELVINAFVTQMSDGSRLRIIDEAGSQVDRNYAAMQALYQQSSLLSLNRARDENDVAATKALYGIQ